MLVTRPAPQAETLSRLLQARGAQVRRLPLQAIEPVRHPQRAARVLAASRDARAWIFTSVNAVQHAQQLDGGVWPPVMAVGRATAVALERLGLQPRVPDAAYSSKALLALPELQAVAGCRFVVIAGEDGLTTLVDTLEARGAEVARIAVYRRVALPLPPAQLQEALHDSEFIVITSGEALQHLADASAPALLPQLRRLRLVVPSQRVVEQAARLGFEATPLVPDHVADEAYVRCLEQWRATNP